MAAQVKLRTDQLDKFCRLARLPTDDARAKFCDLSPSAWSRTVRGQQPPSGQFIGGVLAAFAESGITFEDLFEVTDDPDSDGDGDGADEAA
jgi:hypothetical protein